jgi:hypothetical protein
MLVLLLMLAAAVCWPADASQVHARRRSVQEAIAVAQRDWCSTTGAGRTGCSFDSTCFKPEGELLSVLK